jgi:hypothetical protein
LHENAVAPDRSAVSLLHLAEQAPADVVGALSQLVPSGRELAAVAHFCSGRIASSDVASTPGRHVLAFRLSEGSWSGPTCSRDARSRSRGRSGPERTLITTHATGSPEKQWSGRTSVAAGTVKLTA